MLPKRSNGVRLVVAVMFVLVAPRGSWSSVAIPDPVARYRVIEALTAASTRFAAPRCRTLLTEFTDRDGQPLTATLARLGVDVSTYVTTVTFIDGSREPTCSGNILAFTTPGSRVVRVCATRLKVFAGARPDYVAAAFIHEILHTLGLGENPPSSREITARVLDRCW